MSDQNEHVPVQQAQPMIVIEDQIQPEQSLPLHLPLDYSVYDADLFKNFVDEHIKKHKKKASVAIFTHKTPDPDAIGCMMGMKYLFETCYSITARMFTDGDVSHPQNVSMVQLLDPPLEKMEQFDSSKFTMTILVDVIPSGKIGVGGRDINFDVVIDHHKDLPTNFEGLLIHHHVGSCSTIVYNILSKHGVVFNRDNDVESKTATALLVGLITDTNFCLSSDSISPDWITMQELAKARDEESLEAILTYERPMSWVRLKALAINEALQNGGIEEGIAVLGLGMLKGDQRDVLSDIAEDVLTWKLVHTVVVFAMFDGDRIEGAIRTRQRAAPLSEIAKKLGGNGNGSGGARGTKGGYVKYLGPMSIESDEPDELKMEMWEAVKKREISKIFRAINK